MIVDRLLTEVDRQKKYLDRLPTTFEFPLFNGTQALESQRRNGYRNTAAAARELIDNALEAGAKRIHVIFETRKQGRQVVTAVAVIDDGAGMLASMARYALSWGGGTHHDDPSFIGRFGFGLPNASINQTRRVEVYTRTAPADRVIKAWLDATEFPEHGLQTIKPPIESDIPKFVKEYLDRNQMEFSHGTIVVWVDPDRLTYKTPASLKEHLLDDFGSTYRYLLNNIELMIDGKQVEPVDPLFLDANARYYRSPEEDGATSIKEMSLPVTLREDKLTGAMHLEKVKDVSELNQIREKADSKQKHDILTVGTIHLRVARFPLGFAVGRKGDGKIEALDEFSKLRFEIRQSRRGMSFVRAGREIETVDAFPRSAKDRSSGLGDWPLLQSYAYHWGVEVKFDPDLDDVFGITNDKQRVRPIEDFWKLLAQEDFDTLLNEENNWQHREREKRARAAREPQTASEPTAAELSASIVETVVGQPQTIPEDEKPKLQEQFKAAVERASQISGKSLDEAAKAVEEEARRRKYRIDYFDDPRGPFYRPEWENGLVVVVWVNRAHPFYQTLYTAPKTKFVKEGLDLLLIALADSELRTSESTARQRYERLRSREWSDFLEIGMKDLASRFEGNEEVEEVA